MEDHAAFTISPDVSKRYRPLQLHSHLNWDYASTFLVSWQDAQTNNEMLLGGLSDEDNGHKAEWFISFGANDAGEVMLHICLPLKLGGRGIWPMFLVIPADSFDSVSCPEDFVPPTTPRFKRAGVHPGTKLLRCRFKLKERGFALMPLPKSMRPFSDHFRGLLLSLKSLSLATNFDIYLPSTVGSRRVVQSFFEMVQRGPSQSPEIDLRETFDGRKAGQNLWKEYGIDDEETLALEWNPIIEDTPPAYDEVVRTSPQNIRDAHTPPLSTELHDHLRLFQASTSIPDTDQSFYEEGEVESGSSGDHEVQDDEQVDRERVTSRDGEGQAVPPAATGVQEQEHREASEDPQHSDQCERYSQQNRPPKRKAGEAFSDVAPDRGRFAPIGDTATARKKKGLRTKRKTYIPFISRLTAADREAYERQAEILLLSGVTTAPSSILSPDGPNRSLFNKSQFRWFCDAVLWLRATWPRKHCILTTHRDELHLMCQAIHRQDRAPFEKARKRCMEKFLTDAPVPSAEHPWQVKLVHRVEWVAEFVYNALGAGSDTLIIDELQALHYLATEWQKAGGDRGTPDTGQEQAYADRETAFQTQMAACVLVAFYKFEIFAKAFHERERGSESPVSQVRHGSTGEHDLCQHVGEGNGLESLEGSVPGSS